MNLPEQAYILLVEDANDQAQVIMSDTIYTFIIAVLSAALIAWQPTRVRSLEVAIRIVESIGSG